MMTRATADNDDWQARARASLRNQRAAWLGTITTGAVSGGLLGLGLNLHDDIARLVVFSAGLVALVGCLLWGTVIYMRVIDEQERDANLWSCYVGMVVYLALYVVKLVGTELALHLPITESGIFITTMIVVLAVFVWRRFS